MREKERERGEERVRRFLMRQVVTRRMRRDNELVSNEKRQSTRPTYSAYE